MNIGLIRSWAVELCNVDDEAKLLMEEENGRAQIFSDPR